MTIIPDPSHRRAELSPDEIAFVEEATGRASTFAEVDGRAERIASALEDRGLRRGERVAVLCHNTALFFEILFAAGKAGLILVPLNWRQTPAELAPILQDCAARLLLHDAAHTGLAAALAHDGCPTLGFAALEVALAAAPIRPRDRGWPADQVWYLLYTSGTTGRPKAVIQTPGMMMANAINVVEATKMMAGFERMINFLPLFHTAGINLHTLPVFLWGGTSHILPKFDLDQVMELLVNGGITMFFAVPAIYQAISLSPRAGELGLCKVRHWGCGGAPMPEPLLEEFFTHVVFVRNGMGMTETGPTAFFMNGEDVVHKVGSVGKPRLLTEVRLVDAHGNDVPEGEAGEILFRGPGITPGYFNNPEATEKAFAPGGWLRSGDVGRRDADGCYYIVDRIKDMYISGGENVYPAEVEAALNLHPAVFEAIVVGVPDPRWGETGRALIRLRPGKSATVEEIRAFARERLAAYKVPRDIVFVEDYPRTAAGKVQKHLLKSEAGA